MRLTYDFSCPFVYSWGKICKCLYMRQIYIIPLFGSTACIKWAAQPGVTLIATTLAALTYVSTIRTQPLCQQPPYFQETFVRFSTFKQTAEAAGATFAPVCLYRQHWAAPQPVAYTDHNACQMRFGTSESSLFFAC